jgi:hypothetical protein
MAGPGETLGSPWIDGRILWGVRGSLWYELIYSPCGQPTLDGCYAAQGLAACRALCGRVWQALTIPN